MGNARWTGVPLKRVLEKAGVKAGAVQVSFNGLDQPPIGDGPDFVKALPIDHALDGEVMLAWQMNGAELPVPQRLPAAAGRARLLRHLLDQAPVRHQGARQAVRRLLDDHRLSHPDNPCACVEPGTTPAATVPIGRFNVRSFITSRGRRRRRFRRTVPRPIRGIAFDGGQGIARSGVLGRRRQDLAARAARRQSRALLVPRMDRAVPAGRERAPTSCRCAPSNRAGETQPADAALEPRRLHAQRHRNRPGRGGVSCR